MSLHGSLHNSWKVNHFVVELRLRRQHCVRTVWSGGFLELHLRYLNSLLNPPDGRHLSLCVITEITFTALSMNWVCGIATVFCIACTAGTCLCYAAGVFNSVCCTTGVVTSLLDGRKLDLEHLHCSLFDLDCWNLLLHAHGDAGQLVGESDLHHLRCLVNSLEHMEHAPSAQHHRPPCRCTATVESLNVGIGLCATTAKTMTLSISCNC